MAAQKILYVVSTLQQSGPTEQLYNVIQHLDKRVFEPHLITLSKEPADSRWNAYPMTYGTWQGQLVLKHHLRAFRKMTLRIGVSNAVE